jgi:hypothetical protein
MTGRQWKQYRTKGATLRAEEGDETVDELADEAAKAKKELRESTKTGEKVQQESEHSGKQH